MLDYEHSKIEVLIADGGSTDKTIDIAKSYKVTILHNKHRIAEYGKKIAYDNSTGEVVIFLDADNIIGSKDWLKKLLVPLKDNSVIGVESDYLFAKDFSSLNTYANLLIIVDPLARLMASKPVQVKQGSSYIKMIYKAGSNPVSGANGFLWKRDVIELHNVGGLQLNEVSMLDAIANKQKTVIAKIPNIGIYHYYCNNLADYIAKRKKIACKHLARKKVNETWVDKRGKMKLIGSTLYLLTIIGPLFEAIKEAVQSRRIEWMYHPLVGFITINLYIYYYFKEKFQYAQS